MNPLEIVAVLLGLANIVLIVRRSLWNYPFGLAMVTLYFFIFSQARLYSDALLQIFFFVVQIYGWWCWMRGRDAAGELVVKRAGASGIVLFVLACALATALWGWLMHRFTDAAFPWWDAAVAMVSIGAQFLMSRRYLENWWAWIVVNMLAIGLYSARELWLTAGLYAVFLAIAFWGWRAWLIAGRDRSAAPA